MKVAINGFGRIGRLSFRKLYKEEDIEIVAINDLTSPHMLAYLLRNDSVQKKFDAVVEEAENGIIVDGKLFPVYAEADASKLPWGELGIDVVLECTGFYTSKAKSQAHIDAGAKKVLISAPAGNDLPTIVYGTNHETLTKEDTIVSGASCTTNCLAPMAKALADYRELRTGFMTTIHAYTGDQMILDGPHRKGDLRRARAGAINIVPNSTGAAKASKGNRPCNPRAGRQADRIRSESTSTIRLDHNPRRNTQGHDRHSICRGHQRGNEGSSIRVLRLHRRRDRIQRRNRNELRFTVRCNTDTCSAVRNSYLRGKSSILVRQRDELCKPALQNTQVHGHTDLISEIRSNISTQTHAHSGAGCFFFGMAKAFLPDADPEGFCNSNRILYSAKVRILRLRQLDPHTMFCQSAESEALATGSAYYVRRKLRISILRHSRGIKNNGRRKRGQVLEMRGRY